MNNRTQQCFERTKLELGLQFKRADPLYELRHDRVRIFEAPTGSFWLVLQRHRYTNAKAYGIVAVIERVVQAGRKNRQ